MKLYFNKFWILGLLLLSSSFLFGQVDLDESRKENYQLLKNSTLYFVCPENLLEQEDSLQTLVDDAWNYCDIKVIRYKEMIKYHGKSNVAFLSISRSLAFGARLTYELWVAKNPLKDEFGYYPYTSVIAALPLSVNCYVDSFIRFHELNTEVLLEYLYGSAVIENLKPGIICNNLKILERELGKAINSKKGMPKQGTEELKDLTDETLYITDNVKYQFFPTTYRNLRLCTKRETNIKKLMVDYPYPYKVITYDELNDKLLNGDKFIYLISFDFDDERKGLYIYGENGDLLYANILDHPFFRPNDFKQIVKEINK